MLTSLLHLLVSALVALTPTADGHGTRTEEYLPHPPSSASVELGGSRCEEDEPCWDCRTMGNHVCGTVQKTPTNGGPPSSIRLPELGERWGSLTIRRLGLRGVPLVQGTGEDELAAGVGHIPSTYLPGMGGSIALFGHRVTPVGGRPYGYLRFIDQLRRGDRIQVTTRWGRFTYVVRRHRVVGARAWGAFTPELGRERLTLAACTPAGSDRYRYVVVARKEMG